MTEKMKQKSDDAIRIDVRTGTWHDYPCGRRSVFDVNVVAGKVALEQDEIDGGIQTDTISAIVLSPYTHMTVDQRPEDQEKFGIRRVAYDDNEVRVATDDIQQDYNWLSERPKSFTRKRSLLFVGNGEDFIEELEAANVPKKIILAGAMAIGMARFPENFS